MLPRLAEEVPGIFVFYEIKSNLNLERSLAFKNAGISIIQAGIEALSSSLLRRMKKGVTGAKNVGMLRHAQSLGLHVTWNLLYDFPGDRPEDYRETLALLPLLHHLRPPVGFFPLSIDRFSPYFKRPEHYGIRSMQPIEGYDKVYPPEADLGKIAYHFEADYDSAARSHPELIAELEAAIRTWQEAWDDQPPLLNVRKLTPETYLLLDQRGLPGHPVTSFLDARQASLLLAQRKLPTPEPIDWALERGLGVELDGFWVPLATADAELLRWADAEARKDNVRVTTEQPTGPGLPVVQS